MREALAALAHAETVGHAKIIAGGQSLGPMLNLRLTRPKMLIDISRLEALQAISDAGDAWRFGALVTHARLEDDGDALRGCGFLAAVARGIAFRSVRNRGTMGGSMAHADPAADWPLALAALDAVVVVRSAIRQRTISADRFVTAAFTTALRDDEMIEAILVPKLSTQARFGYFKFCRKVGEFAEASGAAVFDPERRVGRVFIGALDGPVVSLPSLAHGIAEEGPAAATPATIQAAMAKSAPALDRV